MPPTRVARRISLAALALALAAGGALWLYRAWPAPAPPAAPARKAAVVLAAGPGVERAGRGAPWTAAHAGDELAVTDSIRTGPEGTAEVALGHGSRVTISERSELTVRELTEASERLGLLRGRVAVDHRPDGTRLLRVESESGGEAASAARGRWAVVAAPSTLGVAALEGAVRVESAGAVVEVPAGQQTAAWRGHPPLAPRPVPRTVVLHVARALEARRASACTVLEAEPGSEVAVEGEPVEVPRDGRIIVRVPPRGRRHEVEVIVRDPSGSVERQVIPCWDQGAAVSDLEVRWNSR